MSERDVVGERRGIMRWTVNTDQESLRSARRSVEGFAASHGLPAEKIRDLALAVAEALFNAKDHGGCASRVALEAVARDDRIEVAVEDDGEDPEARCSELRRYLETCSASAPEAEQERGRGLYLIRRKTDDVRVERVGSRGVRVILVKRR